ncbi:hypothetical protein DNTS_008502 [Danionella cerebrum]|uniref:Uncharacterized protein n=1 Tax=Danionella cerebrum TaxID=2873325 RepID=A0A553QG82_9TELE|nr:hypothetical protein DNTS_008502 [Danionella translucida]
MSARSLCFVAFCISLFLSTEAQSGETNSNLRPYDVLLKQNLVLFLSVLSTLVVIMIGMAVCVYKPLRRR